MNELEIKDLNAYYGDFLAVSQVNMDIPDKSITAFIGPSGCGKSTLLRTLNRMHEAVPGGRITGEVALEGQDLYGSGVDPVGVRRKVGMVFQKANPFPSMSIYENVIAGVRLRNKRISRKDADELVERSLRQANLWDEVHDRLQTPGGALSGGQQQRLCIARAVAVEPKVILLDEPCSALDPVSTLAIEQLLLELKERYTVVIVTHNMQQAARVSDQTAFFHADAEAWAELTRLEATLGDKSLPQGTRPPGRLVEYAPTDELFNNPRNKATADYLSGRFG
ncbi:MAG: phosphate ABC transporter ATP-binding protein PstB [Propionibacteriaceae bacterium]|nr:phosphate ABC transporter ATP-binding protein PstB [Propionibacteriaceae bacterium]